MSSAASGLIHNLATSARSSSPSQRRAGAGARPGQDHAQPPGARRHLGKDSNPDTIEGIVLMLKYQNPSQTLRGVHAKVAELNRQLAKDGVRIVPYIDRDDLVKNATISKVGRTMPRASAWSSSS
jgi:hypothetical protein